MQRVVAIHDSRKVRSPSLLRQLESGLGSTPAHLRNVSLIFHRASTQRIAVGLNRCLPFATEKLFTAYHGSKYPLQSYQTEVSLIPHAALLWHRFKDTGCSGNFSILTSRLLAYVLVKGLGNTRASISPQERGL
jgi:hypothetical protein